METTTKLPHGMERYKAPRNKSYFYIAIIILLCILWTFDHAQLTEKEAGANSHYNFSSDTLVTKHDFYTLLNCKFDFGDHDSTLMATTVDATMKEITRVIKMLPKKLMREDLIRTLNDSNIKPRVISY